MTEIVYKRGCLTNASEYIIAHGCNAMGVFNSGVAKSIRQKWPGSYKSYIDHYKSRGKLYPGQVIWAESKGKLIANCITQYYYGRDGKQYVEYDAIRECLRAINKFECKELGLAMPLIGAGLGGGDWEIISKIICEEITNVNPVVYILPTERNIVKSINFPLNMIAIG